MKIKHFSKSLLGLVVDFMVKRFIHLVGLRFYEHNSGDSDHGEILVGQSEIRSIGETSAQFKFYRKVYKVRVYRRGRVHTEKFIGYSIECTFDDSFSNTLKSYNSVRFTVKQNSLKFIEEKAIMHTLLEFYLEFITSEINKSPRSSRAAPL